MSGPFVRQRRRSRETGTIVLVLDLDARDSDTLNEGNRWETVCDTHGYVCSHPTLALARAHAAMPSGWCEECNDETPTGREAARVFGG